MGPSFPGPRLVDTVTHDSPVLVRASKLYAIMGIGEVSEFSVTALDGSDLCCNKFHGHYDGVSFLRVYRTQGGVVFSLRPCKGYKCKTGNQSFGSGPALRVLISFSGSVVGWFSFFFISTRKGMCTDPFDYQYVPTPYVRKHVRFWSAPLVIT
jgi:hypothetical protein